MKVCMNVAISGTRNGEPWPSVGGEIVVGDIEGADLCAAGLASPVAEVAKVEKKVAPKPEVRAGSKARR